MSESTQVKHDPSCPYGDEFSLMAPDQCAPCALIRKTREDERNKCIAEIQAVLDGMTQLEGDDAKAALLAAPDLTAGDWWWCQRGVARAIMALKGFHP